VGGARALRAMARRPAGAEGPLATAATEGAALAPRGPFRQPGVPIRRQEQPRWADPRGPHPGLAAGVRACPRARPARKPTSAARRDAKTACVWVRPACARPSVRSARHRPNAAPGVARRRGKNGPACPTRAAESTSPASSRLSVAACPAWTERAQKGRCARWSAKSALATPTAAAMPATATPAARPSRRARQPGRRAAATQRAVLDGAGRLATASAVWRCRCAERVVRCARRTVTVALGSAERTGSAPRSSNVRMSANPVLGTSSVARVPAPIRAMGCSCASTSTAVARSARSVWRIRTAARPSVSHTRTRASVAATSPGVAWTLGRSAGPDRLPTAVLRVRMGETGCANRRSSASGAAMARGRWTNAFQTEIRAVSRTSVAVGSVCLRRTASSSAGLAAFRWMGPAPPTATAATVCASAEPATRTTSDAYRSRARVTPMRTAAVEPAIPTPASARSRISADIERAPAVRALASLSAAGFTAPRPFGAPAAAPASALAAAGQVGPIPTRSGPTCRPVTVLRMPPVRFPASAPP